MPVPGNPLISTGNLNLCKIFLEKSFCIYCKYHIAQHIQILMLFGYFWMFYAIFFPKTTTLMNLKMSHYFWLRSILGFDFDEKSIYEFRLESEAVNMTIWNFLLPFFRIKGRSLYFDQFRFFAKAPRHNTKK